MRKLLAALFGLALLGGLAWAQAPLFYPAGQAGPPIPLISSSVATTGVNTVTLVGAPNKWTYLCGFTFTSAGTSTTTVVNATITGLTSTMNFTYTYVISNSTLPLTFTPNCLSTPTTSTSVVITFPAGGGGTSSALNAWGYTN